jgi:hypothetical protein
VGGVAAAIAAAVAVEAAVVVAVMAKRVAVVTDGLSTVAVERSSGCGNRGLDNGGGRAWQWLWLW